MLVPKESQQAGKQSKWCTYRVMDRLGPYRAVILHIACALSLSSYLAAEKWSGILVGDIDSWALIPELLIWECELY